MMGVIYGFLFGLVWSRENEGEVAEKNKTETSSLHLWTQIRWGIGWR
jgi:hypothetical protein